MERIKKFLKWIHRINQNQWFIVSIITTTVGIWFPLIIGFFGVKLHLVVTTTDGDKKLTAIGLILTCLTIIWSLLSNISQRYHEQTADKSFSEEESKNRLLQPLKTSFFNLCNLKLFNLLREIGKIKDGSNTLDNSIIETPCKQLEETSVQISNAISDIFTTRKNNLKPEDIYVSIYYNFPEEGTRWALAEKHGGIRGLNIDELFEDSTTFFQLLKDEKKHLLFFNSKQEAFEKHMYKPDSYDVYDKGSGKIIGSILCYKRSFKTDDKALINCMICVSTNGKTLIKNPTKEIIHNMENFMENTALKEFSTRIGIELCFHYLHRLKNKNP